MNRTADAPHRWLAGALVGLWLVMLPCRTVEAAGAKTRDPHETMTALGRQVLADPANVALRQDYELLRREEVVQQQKALEALAHGLEAYVEGQFAEAAASLQKAARCSAVMQWAKWTAPMDRVAAACGVRPRRAKAAVHVCPECGGTNQADCSDCRGAGWKRCTRCKGTGQYRSRSRYSRRALRRPCETCKRTGMIACGTCKGRGSVPCKACAARAKMRRPGPANAAVRRAVRQLILKARYRHAGGLLFDDPAMLEPVPWHRQPQK